VPSDQAQLKQDLSSTPCTVRAWNGHA